MNLRIALTLLVSLFAVTARAASEEAGPPPPRVQIAILLDNSGSMGGLINQARAQLWKVVNEFATARQRGRPLRLELALYEYGERPVRLSAFTTNLDQVSEQLFGMGIRGGDEHCGQVIAQATRELEWSGNPDDLKLIYIAGNEPFTQGPVAPRVAIDAARKKGIVVNVIHADSSADATWNQAAMLAGTTMMQIDHNARVATIVAPQDQRLAELGARLNSTYVGYGTRGAAGAARQQAMDEAARKVAPASSAERVVSKSSANYVNDDWDLVDAKKAKKLAVKDLAEDQLPAEMRGMNGEEREAFVAAKASEREEIQKEIAELSQARARYVAEKQKAAPAPSTLDKAMIDSVHSAAGAKAITFQ